MVWSVLVGKEQAVQVVDHVELIFPLRNNWNHLVLSDDKWDSSIVRNHGAD